MSTILICLPANQWMTSPTDSLQNLAVQLDGRKKPLDTVARETVAQIHGSTRYRQDNGETLDYLHTYLSLWLNDRDWNSEKFILFNYLPLKEMLRLDPDRQYFSFQELVNSHLGAFVLSARQKQASDRDLSREEREALKIADRLELMLSTVGETPPIVAHPTDIKGTWVSLDEAEVYYPHEQVAPLQAELELMEQSYQFHAENMLGQLAQKLHQDLADISPEVYPATSVLQREIHYHAFHPFGKACQLYACAFLAMLLVVGLQSKKTLEDWYWGPVGIFVAGILVQSYGFLLRIQISGRPPVTNMYESVVWVGFGIAAFALLFELGTRAKYYLLAGAPLAGLCLLLADRLPAVLDASIQPLVPVLRDNFWLSVHVPTITLSYASFALAMGLGHVILGNYIFAPTATERIQRLSQLNYRVLQLGVLLLVTGIILGGIWAHFAWGRFWGWDPKETWALIALLCYLLPLHGRKGGWIGNLGMAIASVVSFNGVLMAWYGVNFVLGKGLHSYGFSTGGSELIVASIVGLDLLFVLAAVAKDRGWLTTSRTQDLIS